MEKQSLNYFFKKRVQTNKTLLFRLIEKYCSVAFLPGFPKSSVSKFTS